MSMSRRTKGSMFVVWLMVGVMLVMLAACSQQGNEKAEETPAATNNPVTDKPAAETPKPEETAKAPDAEPVEIVIYTYNNADETFFNAMMGDGLKKKFPNYTFKYLNGQTGGSVEQMLLNNTPFDVYFSTTGRAEGQAFQNGFAYDMADLLKKHQVDLKAFDPAFNDLLGPAFGDRIFVLPFRADSFLMYYNKGIFDRFGVEYLTDGMTWDEVYEVAGQLTRKDSNIQYVGYTPAISGMLRTSPLSISLVEPGSLKPTINTDPGWQTFAQKFILDAVPAADRPLINEYGSDWNGFIAGTLGIYLGEDVILAPEYQTYLENIEWDFVAVPSLAETPGIGRQPLTYNIGISSMSKHKDEAMEALKYIVSPEHQMSLSKQGYGSVLADQEIRKMQASDHEYLKDKNLAALSYNRWPEYTYFGVTAEDVRKIYAKHLGKMLSEGQTDYNTLFREAEEEAMLTIEEIKKTISIDGMLK